MNIPFHRNILFQIPYESTEKGESDIMSIIKYMERFNYEYKTNEGIVVNPGVYLTFDAERLGADISDGVVILADEHYSRKDLEESIKMYKCPSLVDKPKIILRDENDNSVPMELAERVEGMGQKTRTRYLSYPGKSVDKDFPFDGFKSVGDAFFYYMEFPVIRMEFLDYLRNYEDLVEYHSWRIDKYKIVDPISANTALARLTELRKFIHGIDDSEKVIPFQYAVSKQKG